MPIIVDSEEINTLRCFWPRIFFQLIEKRHEKISFFMGEITRNVLLPSLTAVWVTWVAWDAWSTLSASLPFTLFITGDDSTHGQRWSQEMYVFLLWYGVYQERRCGGGPERCWGQRQKIRLRLFLSMLQNESPLLSLKQNPCWCAFFFSFLLFFKFRFCGCHHNVHPTPWSKS